MAFAVFKFRDDRNYGLTEEQVWYLVEQLHRRLTIPKPIARLIERLQEEARKDPDREEKCEDIVLDDDQKPGLLDTLRKARPDGDQPAWDALLKRVEQDVIEAQGHI
jgi:hypothetical protein